MKLEIDTRTTGNNPTFKYSLYYQLANQNLGNTNPRIEAWTDKLVIYKR
jgi:hypothetical protein